MTDLDFQTLAAARAKNHRKMVAKYTGKPAARARLIETEERLRNGEMWSFRFNHWIACEPWSPPMDPYQDSVAESQPPSLNSVDSVAQD